MTTKLDPLESYISVEAVKHSHHTAADIILWLASFANLKFWLSENENILPFDEDIQKGLFSKSLSSALLPNDGHCGLFCVALNKTVNISVLAAMNIKSTLLGKEEALELLGKFLEMLKMSESPEEQSTRSRKIRSFVTNNALRYRLESDRYTAYELFAEALTYNEYTESAFAKENLKPHSLSRLVEIQVDVAKVSKTGETVKMWNFNGCVSFARKMKPNNIDEFSAYIQFALTWAALKRAALQCTTGNIVT